MCNPLGKLSRSKMAHISSLMLFQKASGPWVTCLYRNPCQAYIPVTFVHMLQCFCHLYIMTFKTTRFMSLSLHPPDMLNWSDGALISPKHLITPWLPFSATRFLCWHESYWHSNVVSTAESLWVEFSVSFSYIIQNCFSSHLQSIHYFWFTGCGLQPNTQEFVICVNLWHHVWEVEVYWCPFAGHLSYSYTAEGSKSTWMYWLTIRFLSPQDIHAACQHLFFFAATLSEKNLKHGIDYIFRPSIPCNFIWTHKWLVCFSVVLLPWGLLQLRLPVVFSSLKFGKLYSLEIKPNTLVFLVPCSSIHATWTE